MLVTILFRIFSIPVSFLSTKKIYAKPQFYLLFYMVGNLVYHIEWRTQTEDVWEQGTEGNIWA
jgi:hypothetical protein